MSIFRPFVTLYLFVFKGLERLTEGWLLGLAARLAFCSVLLVFFLNSAATKVGSGFPGVLIPSSSAYAQILPAISEQAGYDHTKIELFPYGLIVYLGTYSEFILPVLILVGLFTRLASLGMLAFVAVMTYVDIVFHKVDAKTIGAFFDRIQDSPIADQRLLWCVPLLVLLIKGPGVLSLDYLLGRRVGLGRD